MPASFRVMFEEDVSEFPEGIQAFGDVIKGRRLPTHDVLAVLRDPACQTFARLAQEFHTSKQTVKDGGEVLGLDTAPADCRKARDRGIFSQGLIASSPVGMRTQFFIDLVGEDFECAANSFEELRPLPGNVTG